MKKSFISKIINILFIIMFITMICCLPFIPKLYNLFKDLGVPLFENQSLIYKIAFYVCYIVCIIIIYLLIKLFSCVYKESPFNKKVINSLNISSILFMILFIIVIIKALFIPTLLSFAVALVCLIASLSFYVLKEVIKSACFYKKEVDLVI